MATIVERRLRQAKLKLREARTPWANTPQAVLREVSGARCCVIHPTLCLPAPLPACVRVAEQGGTAPLAGWPNSVPVCASQLAS